MHKEIVHIIRLRDLKVEFRVLWEKKIGKYHGLFDKDVITINLKSRIPPGKIFLHECLHKMYPEMGKSPTEHEKLVLKMENKIWNELTVKEMLFLYKKMISSA